jgi:hypothetical protein
MEFLIEVVLEIVVQLFFEVLATGFDGVFALSEKNSRRAGRIALYFIMGIGFGYLSYLVMPHTLSGRPPSALFSLLLIPSAVGTLGVLISRWSEKRLDWEVATTGFFYSAILAFAFSTTRYLMLGAQ